MAFSIESRMKAEIPEDSNEGRHSGDAGVLFVFLNYHKGALGTSMPTTSPF